MWKSVLFFLTILCFSQGCRSMSDAYWVQVVNRERKPLPQAEVYVQFKKKKFMRVAEIDPPERLKVNSNGSFKVPSVFILNRRSWGNWIQQIHASAPGYKPQSRIAARFENTSTTTNPQWEHPLKESPLIILEKGNTKLPSK